MSEEVTWLCGLPNSVRRGRFKAVDRDAAAFAYAKLHRYDPISVEHVGDGWYDVTGEGLEPGKPWKYPRSFRVNRAPDQSRRGVDETAARTALCALHGPSWAVREPYIVAEGRYGKSGRADLCVLPDGEGSVGYEIKTDRDVLDRLTRQIPLYDHCFSRRVLATTPRHVDASRRLLPAEWGIVLLDPDTHRVLDQVRPAAAQDHDLARGTLLLSELWAAELHGLIKDRNLAVKKRAPIWTCLTLLKDTFDEATLRDMALQTLNRRQGTRVHAWRIGDS
ncbi:sce7726 family protein [Deinococcus soli (ex Cha et al. 2016)]|uniref:Uncharacterized protein n=1 Tax=Deinococcus soli (ex Cha et al. 2016) TaxID=1309411 RepID=A0ACC6KNK4_9DEIO|nr:sce7726 family protein [Deinococcus soli (ex Cha et al. 2016)]MDR6330662.1 hypothetical protein [Deinococcus soli (ex Cha et al. 2016)]MDR6754029.1 hypothetical protein [Deinococcus soli (ex Cha et al. 2016)]